MEKTVTVLQNIFGGKFFPFFVWNRWAGHDTLNIPAHAKRRAFKRHLVDWTCSGCTLRKYTYFKVADQDTNRDTQRYTAKKLPRYPEYLRDS